MTAEKYLSDWLRMKYGTAKEVGDWFPEDVFQFAEDYHQKQMNDINANRAMQEMNDAEKCENEKMKLVLMYVKAKVPSDDHFREIESVIEESDYTFGFVITSEPKGEYQLEDSVLGGYWVNQTCNGGYTGDSFAGTISIKISESEYLEFGYSM